MDLAEEEYYNVFDTIYPNDNEDCSYNSYCELFDRVGIHWRFVITKAADDRNVLDNASILQKYSECIKNEYSLCVSNSEVCSSNHYNRWSLAYSVFYIEPFINLFDGYKSQLGKIQNKIINNIVLQ